MHNFARDTHVILNMATATPGGYGYGFVHTLHDRFICKICHLPSRDPYLSVCCGHLFCKSCLDEKSSTDTNAVCPICHDEEFKTFPNKAIDRDVKGLHIYCTNKEKGCEWQGELNDINNHLENSDGCQFEEVKCSNECGNMIRRQYLSCHLEMLCPRRKVNCQYCHETGEHQFITVHHKKHCHPLFCPNKCKVGSVPREDMEAHRKECPLEMIQCEYHNVGCEVRIFRKDQEKHDDEKMKEHMMMTKHSISGLNDAQHQFMNTLVDTKAQITTAIKQVVNLTVLMNARLSPNTSPPDIRSHLLDSSVMIFKFGIPPCPVIIKIPEFDSKKKDEVEWYSDSFYSHNKGYKMCLRVDAAGHGKAKGTHLSVFLHLMKGPHDDELTWPLRGKFEIKLLNQISDTLHYQMTLIYDHKFPGDRVTEGNKAIDGQGSPQFISNEDLCKAIPVRQFLKGDCLFFRVTKV